MRSLLALIALRYGVGERQNEAGIIDESPRKLFCFLPSFFRVPPPTSQSLAHPNPSRIQLCPCAQLPPQPGGALCPPRLVPTALHTDSYTQDVAEVRPLNLMPLAGSAAEDATCPLESPRSGEAPEEKRT